MSQRTYFSLPINADEGFPQSFQVNFNERLYQIVLYVNVLETETAQAEDSVYQLPEKGAFMVMRVTRVTDSEPLVIFQRKLIRNLEYEAAELAFIFREMRVVKRNLNGIGALGSQVIGGIAAR